MDSNKNTKKKKKVDTKTWKKSKYAAEKKTHFSLTWTPINSDVELKIYQLITSYKINFFLLSCE